MKPIRFTKMHGIGNDYIYINAFEETIDDPVALAKVMADRHFGVGGDGIILICPPTKGTSADVRMRMFNNDGSESEMCGNGIRCVCKYAHDRGLTKSNPMRIETGRGVLMLEYMLDRDGKVEQVTVDMGEPILEAGRIPVILPARSSEERIVDLPMTDFIPEWNNRVSEMWELDGCMTCVSMGNPHVVLFGEWVRAAAMHTLGPILETRRIFPQKINVHVVEVVSRDEVRMRTWERGTGITLACGTGASAVCVAGVLTGRTNRRILAHLPGGDLHLNWDEKTNHVFKTGPATFVFDGTWEPTGSARPA